uniref:Uncharacterized protein n=1 Tax=Schistosoma curassoni TaxID=6186 RepID=A0A183K3T5_9TREM
MDDDLGIILLVLLKLLSVLTPAVHEHFFFDSSIWLYFSSLSSFNL